MPSQHGPALPAHGVVHADDDSVFRLAVTVLAGQREGVGEVGGGQDVDVVFAALDGVEDEVGGAGEVEGVEEGGGGCGGRGGEAGEVCSRAVR